MSRPFIWAHRGASAEAPENTLAAFALAAAYGADGLELDVHLSHDEVPVVLHDETLERTTDGQGAVGSWRLRDLQDLDAGSWFRADYAGESLPTLLEVLAMFAGHLRLNLEVKEPRAGLAILDLLRDFPDADVLISSFDWHLLGRLRQLDAGLPLGLLLDGGDWHRAMSTAVALNAASLHPPADRVSRPLLAACHAAALPVHAWTVDDPARARSLARAGIDGLFTNDPERLIQMLGDGVESRSG